MMAKPERIEELEDDDARRKEQRDQENPRPSVLDRRGPIGVSSTSPVAKPEVNPPEVNPKEARIEREAPKQEGASTPDAITESVWDNEAEIREFRSRWSSIQTAFVDDPRQAVHEADQLVQTVVKALADRFTHQREELYRQWDRGDNVSTEDLRIAVQRYRTFFDRLLGL